MPSRREREHNAKRLKIVARGPELPIPSGGLVFGYDEVFWMTGIHGLPKVPPVGLRISQEPIPIAGEEDRKIDQARDRTFIGVQGPKISIATSIDRSNVGVSADKPRGNKFVFMCKWGSDGFARAAVPDPGGAVGARRNDPFSIATEPHAMNLIGVSNSGNGGSGSRVPYHGDRIFTRGGNHGGVRTECGV